MEVRHDRVRANGLEFHVAACGSGDRLALCLHGFPETWISWRHQLPLLADLGYLVWAPDLRGYGETDRPKRVGDYAIEHLLRDVAGLIAASGSREVVLIGHDWGGLIAWYFAMRSPELLDRLVIMNIPHPARFDEVSRTWKQRRRSWYAMLFQLPALPEMLMRASDYRAIKMAFLGNTKNRKRFPRDVIRAYRDAAARPGALTAMCNYYRALVRGRGAARQRALGYPTIDVPTLMLWGEDDFALCVEGSHRTDEHVSDLTLHYLPEVSHWVQQDAPEAVNSLLADWLEGDGGGRR